MGSDGGARARATSLSAALVLAALFFADVPALAELPNRAMTPGAADTTDPAVVCAPTYARTHRHVPKALRAAVYAEYGVPTDEHRRYTIDHLVPLELGGTNTLPNLWPQSRADARRKDRIENQLHARVCSGMMPLVEAQAAIERDWQTAGR